MDTDTRKFSAVNLSSPWRGVNAIPSGALDEPEQFSIAHLYNEFAAEEGGGGGADYLTRPFSFNWWSH